jgi:hypothetical protein
MNIDKCELPKLDFPTKEENKLCNYEKYSKHAQVIMIINAALLGP